MKVAAIVPAAGKGRRFGSNIQKPYVKLCGKPVIAHTLLALSRSWRVDEIIVAVNDQCIATFKRDVITRYGIKKVRIVKGGKERKDSVFNALKNISPSIDYVLIHDGVRPFITEELIKKSLRAAKRFGAGIVCVPVKPTLKYSDKGERIQSTPERKKLWEAQTPQVFRRDMIETAYKTANKKNIAATDDSMLVEKIGIKPGIVPGSYKNIKITTPEDMELARILMITEKQKNRKTKKLKNRDF